MRMKKVLVGLLAFIMVTTGLLNNGYYVEAETNKAIKITEAPEIMAKPGETTHVKMSIIATDFAIPNPTIEVSAGDNSPFTFTVPTMSVNGSSLTYVYTGAATTLEFDVKAKDTIKIGTYPISIKFSYRDYINDTDTSCTITTSIKVLEEKVPSQLTIGSIKLGDSNLGSKTDLSFTIQNEGEITAKNAYLVMSFGEIADERYTAKNIKLGDLNSGDTKSVSLPITLLTTAGIGRKTLTANFTYKTTDGEELKSTYNININLTAVENVTHKPKLSVKNITYKEGLKPKDSFSLSVNLENIGGAEARNIKVAVEDASVDAAGILKDYFTEGVAVADMKTDAVNTVKVPLKVSKYATSGLKAVKVAITYTDATGNSYTLTDTVYVDITSTNVTPTPAVGTPNIIISNVSQSPAQPKAGDKVEISFDVENKGKADATELKIATEGLSATTFIPLKSEPYLYFEKLKAGEKIRVTIPLIVSDSIVEGLNNITVKCLYTGGGESSAVIPVRDVQNDGGISKPKLIVSKYTTDVEELRAGNIFNFTFDLYNTNASVSAKNITVTVSQAENIFTVTQGSNSFFVNKIEPGETITSTLEMKVKSDATTKAYPIEIVIEYEYDGAEPNPTTGEIGEKKTEKLNLQAVENSRPVVDNVNVYSWDGPVMSGTPATLAFEFYNMGRSPLNNVIARLEGDFMKSDGDMYFIGNVTQGGSTYAEFEVISNMEGLANGVLSITFEDSNGDEVVVTKEFSAEVMSAGTFDPGIPYPDSGEVFNPQIPTVKKEIVPLWAFILIEIVIFFLFVPITRKVIVNVYKSKLRKKEQNQY